MAIQQIPQASRDGLLAQVHPWWIHKMEEWLDSPRFLPIYQAMVSGRSNLAPAATQVFRVLQMPPERVKVVLCGQDPYINGEAHGLSFSSIKGITPSMREIYKEVARTEGRLRTKYTFLDWEEQGVFLLNTNLTTLLKKSLAHDHIGWPWITGDILQTLSKHCGPLVGMAWGTHAKKVMRMNISWTPNRLLLEHTHPAARFQEFTGHGHFSKANEFLVSQGKQPINWTGPDSVLVDIPSFDKQEDNHDS